MHPLIRFFVDLCLLRAAPQDLPASTVIFRLALAADLLTGLLLGFAANIAPSLAFAQGIADLLFSLTLLYLALRIFDREPRFRQTATALLGTGTLLGLLLILPLSLITDAGQGGPSALAGLSFLGIIAWSILVTGHILGHSFDLHLRQGVVIAVAYNLLSYNLISGLFSGS